MSTLKVSQHYQDSRGKAYVESRQTGSDGIGYALNFAYFQPYLRPDHVVLDFGCGNGGMLPHLRSHVRHVDGLEVNPAAAAKARDTGCEVFGSLDSLPAERRYDVVVSNHVLEHVRDVCGTLELLRQRLHPGGQVIVKLPIDDFRSSHQRRWSTQDIDHHLQTWTPRLFANVLRESGFDVRQCRVITSAWHPKLFPLMKFGLGSLAFWGFAVLKRRRQLIAIGQNRTA